MRNRKIEMTKNICIVFMRWPHKISNKLKLLFNICMTSIINDCNNFHFYEQCYNILINFQCVSNENFVFFLFLVNNKQKYAVGVCIINTKMRFKRYENETPIEFSMDFIYYFHNFLLAPFSLLNFMHWSKNVRTMRKH